MAYVVESRSKMDYYICMLPGYLSCARPQGWGLLSQFLPFCCFPNFSFLSNTLKFLNIMLLCFRYFCCNIENFADGEINKQSFSNPHPCMWGLLLAEYVFFVEVMAWISNYNQAFFSTGYPFYSKINYANIKIRAWISNDIHISGI